MTPSRRRFLRLGGEFLASLSLLRAVRAAEDGLVEIRMAGTANGSHVWFDPIGILVPAGTTIRWINEDPGNAHTATAYHPDNFDHALRIPAGARPWDSDYLLPGESFEVTLTVPGVYDYFCAPHEHAGMVGRIIVGEAGDTFAEPAAAAGSAGLPDVALRAFPAIADILTHKVIHPRS